MKPFIVQRNYRQKDTKPLLRDNEQQVIQTHSQEIQSDCSTSGSKNQMIIQLNLQNYNNQQTNLQNEQNPYELNQAIMDDFQEYIMEERQYTQLNSDQVFNYIQFFSN